MKAPYLRYDSVRVFAERLLDEHWPSREIPVEIELIAERDLGLQIIPMPSLQEAYDVESFLSADRTSITVDERLFKPHLEGRYNFTLAHEVGHLRMHGDVYSRASAVPIGEWLPFMEEVNRDPQFDRQANNFAGLVLVPSPQLRSPIVEEAVRAVDDSCVDEGLRAGLEPYIVCEAFSSLACEILAPNFKVSAEVIQIRLQREGRWPIVDLDDEDMIVLR